MELNRFEWNYGAVMAYFQGMEEQRNYPTLYLAGGALGVAALIYLLLGKRGRQNRKKLADLSERAWAFIKIQARRLESVNEDMYLKFIDAAKNRFASLEKVDSREILQMFNELKLHWQHITGQMNSGKIAAGPENKLKVGRRNGTRKKS